MYDVDIPSGYGDVKAISTRWAGVNFRSRLEARWAAFFDLCGWRWEYEPEYLYDWLPDFALYPDGDGRRILVEVKPEGVVDLWLLKRRMVRAVQDKPNDLLLLVGQPHECDAEIYERPQHHGEDLLGRPYAEAVADGQWRPWLRPGGRERGLMARELVRTGGELGERWERIARNVRRSSTGPIHILNKPDVSGPPVRRNQRAPLADILRRCWARVRKMLG